MSDSPLQLRRARAEDSAACLALVTAVLAEFGLQPDPRGTEADLADFEAAYFARGGDFAVLVDESGAIVGTCGLFPLAADGVELRKMYLNPAQRGRGQGRRLLDWALARARALGFRRECGGAHSCRCDLAYARDL